MSQENVDLVHRLVDALNAREVPEFIAPDYRLDNAITAVTDTTYFGADGWRGWMRDLFGAFAEGARLQVDEVVADGDDYVVVITISSRTRRRLRRAPRAPLDRRLRRAVINQERESRTTPRRSL
jgi:hypothetical protein